MLDNIIRASLKFIVEYSRKGKPPGIKSRLHTGQEVRTHMMATGPVWPWVRSGGGMQSRRAGMRPSCHLDLLSILLLDRKMDWRK